MVTFTAGYMIKCQSPGGSFRWEVVQMVVDTTITRILSCVVVTGLFQLTSTFLVAPQLPRLFFMGFFSCRRRSTGVRTFLCGGPSEDIIYMLRTTLATCLWKNKWCLSSWFEYYTGGERSLNLYLIGT